MLAQDPAVLKTSPEPWQNVRFPFEVPSKASSNVAGTIGNVRFLFEDASKPFSNVAGTFASEHLRTASRTGRPGGEGRRRQCKRREGMQKTEMSNSSELGNCLSQTVTYFT